MKWLWVLLAVSILGNGLGLYILDRALEYREQINTFEGGFVNEGLHLASSQDIASYKDKPTMACIGGSLFRFWHMPADAPVYFVNKGGLEEKTETTLEHMDETVLASRADMVLINAGFCALHTAVYSGGDVHKAQQAILETTTAIVSKARKHKVVPVLTTLAPVRPRVVFPYAGLIEYDKSKKRRENEAIERMNHLLFEFADESDVRIIDFHAALVDPSGQLRKEFSLQDGEHLSWKGYKALEKKVGEEMLKVGEEL